MKHLTKTLFVILTASIIGTVIPSIKSIEAYQGHQRTAYMAEIGIDDEEEAFDNH